MRGRKSLTGEGWERLRALFLVLLPYLLVAAGIALAFVASLIVVLPVGQETFSGTAPPGDTLLPVNRTGYGSAGLEATVVPCPLLIYPLSGLEYEAYLADGSVPQLSLNCDTPSGAVGQELSQFLLRNLDPEDRMAYAFQVSFFQLRQPNGWAVFPAIGLLGTGTVLLIVRWLSRGLGRLSEEFSSERRK